MKCEYCKNFKKLECFFYYIDKEKFSVFVNIEEMTDDYDWEYNGDIKTFSSYETLEEFKKDFTWCDKIYEYDENYNFSFSGKIYGYYEKNKGSFCSDCFSNLIIEKKIKYKNNGRFIYFPLYTDCCGKFYNEYSSDLRKIYRVSNYPYKHDWFLSHPWNTPINNYEYGSYHLEKFHFSEEDELIACIECLSSYDKFFSNYKIELDDNPLLLTLNYLKDKNKININYINEHWEYPTKNEGVNILRSLINIRDELLIFFLKNLHIGNI